MLNLFETNIYRLSFRNSLGWLEEYCSLSENEKLASWTEKKSKPRVLSSINSMNKETEIKYRDVPMDI
ncbi:hypothetical protein RO3G_06046 [Rhizopus delemar RA 99-880]|uniref:Uncharacterized protein n=1 Tax=Rhizopus delemar (strain RA 99-880 / ATCC MYA-4621 / FGSC 9543 / NRRL 43880) TaxID=246409 RepID=I1BYR1_RHIO9|nr:hypothetical protein RO3G_06046 [Rhizopus delemar RA 99-880]|eukprot:EIE81341.1 hypothetical protein RO3G_06046 [Rhizopus delemar RA 99-880]